MVYIQSRVRPWIWDVSNGVGILDHLISTRKPDLVLKKGTCHLEDFTVPTYHSVKIKENEKIAKYFDLPRELKKQGNKMTVLSIVVGAHGTVPKGLDKGLEGLEIRGGIEPLQTPALLRLTRILRRVLETWRDLLLRLQWKKRNVYFW